MSKNLYTEKDIYEGMVLECFKSDVDHWTVGKKYIVDKNLCMYDDDLDVHNKAGDLVRYLNSDVSHVTFKVVEPKEEHKILQLFNYYFGLKTCDVEEISLWQGDTVIDKYLNVNKKHITIPAYNTQQAIEYLTNELEYDINDIVSMEVK